MANRRNIPTDDQLVQVAELRIQNRDWESVGKELRRKPDTVRRWPMKYPDRWRQAMYHAERRIAIDGEAESVVALRRLLRDEDSAIRWHAAKSLIDLRIDLAKIDVRLLALRPDAGTPTTMKCTMELFEGIPHEQLATLVAAESDRASRLAAGADGTVPTLAP